MEFAGFRITPATRLSVLNVLRSAGKANLQNPKKLKYLLAPVIAKSGQDQQRFYELFDVYWKDVNEALELETKAPKTTEKSKPADQGTRFPNWLWWLIGGLTVALVIGAFIGLFKSQPTNQTIIHFDAPNKEIKLGDSLILGNRSENFDPEQTQFIWELLDVENGEIEAIDTINHHGAFHINALKNSTNKQVRLIGHHRLDKNRDTSSTETITILCEDAVQIQEIIAKKTADPNESITFRAYLGRGTKVDQNLRYNWDFGDGEVEAGKDSIVKHTFLKTGTYRVRLEVERLGAIGACKDVKEHAISIGQKAFLEEKALQEDQESLAAFFNWAVWWLLGMLALLTAYFWRRWWYRPTPEIIKKDKTAHYQKVFHTSDRAPYEIPFESRTEKINIEAGMFRMADTMRVRQEGFRKRLDVPATIKATAENAGFPNARWAVDTKPPEYLFLIDRASKNSHLTNLFQFVTNFLQKNDVYIEVFFYHSQFSRVWNKNYPDGLSLGQIARMYGHFRLIVLGDAYSLVESFAQHQPQLRSQAHSFFQTWNNKTLITPLPAVAWTFREGVLYELFQIFPADVEGIQAAMNYLESEEAIEGRGMESFKRWRTVQQDLRQESDTNYRRWNRVKEYRDYLKDHPKVYLWLCALAVYPEPNWNLTIAIGKALRKKGVVVDYDNLLLLARIPWMQTGILTASLRQQFLKELDISTEELARQAVQNELEDIEDKVVDSHVHFEFQSQLTVQRFILQPENKDHQEAMRYLNNQNLLTKSQTKELNLHLQKKENADMDLAAYLQKADQPNEPPPRPFYTNDFKWASALTGLLLVLAVLIGNLNGSDWLKDRMNPSTAAINADTLRSKPTNTPFIRFASVDSAIILNNQGVKSYYAFKDTIKNKAITEAVLIKGYQTVTNYFERAQAFRTGYQLVEDNSYRLNYNLGVLRYMAGIEKEQIDTSLMSAAFAAFDIILNQQSDPPLKADAMHGQGLALWYLNRKDAAEQMYQTIDSVFFDTLSLYPNLRSLVEGSFQFEGSDLKVEVLPLGLIKIIKEVLNVARESIKVNADLVYDLGADNLDQLEIINEVEKVYDINIDQEPNKIRTVGQLAQLIAKNKDKGYITDRDQDGIADLDDYCPRIKGAADSKGCPPIRRGKFVDTRDGKTYRTVDIAGLKWIAENLNYEMTQSYCFKNKVQNCNECGRLYTFEAARRACPKGWHLATSNEWDQLVGFWDSKILAYQSLRQGGNSGFDILFGGWYDGLKTKQFFEWKSKGEYWTATERTEAKAYRYVFDKNDKTIYLDDYEKAQGYSCRCVEGERSRPSGNLEEELPQGNPTQGPPQGNPPGPPSGDAGGKLELNSYVLYFQINEPKDNYKDYGQLYEEYKSGMPSTLKKMEGIASNTFGNSKGFNELKRFYEVEVPNGKGALDQTIELLAENLRLGKRYVLELTQYNYGPSASNNNELSKRRIESIKKYMLDASKGILRSYEKTGALKFEVLEKRSIAPSVNPLDGLNIDVNNLKRFSVPVTFYGIAYKVEDGK